MRKFDYSFLHNGLLPANLVNLTSNISALKTMAGVRKEDYAQILRHWRQSQRYNLSRVLTLWKALSQVMNALP